MVFLKLLKEEKGSFKFHKKHSKARKMRQKVKTLKQNPSLDNRLPSVVCLSLQVLSSFKFIWHRIWLNSNQIKHNIFQWIDIHYAWKTSAKEKGKLEIMWKKKIIAQFSSSRLLKSFRNLKKSLKTIRSILPRVSSFSYKWQAFNREILFMRLELP